MNDETVDNKNIAYSCPAITAEVGKKYYFEDYTFKFSQKGAAINGNLINWSGDNNITIKNNSFTIKNKGVSTLFAEYNGRVKKFFVVTEKDTVIKTSSDYSDDELTEIELNELKDLFDWTGDYEQ